MSGHKKRKVRTAEFKTKVGLADSGRRRCLNAPAPFEAKPKRGSKLAEVKSGEDRRYCEIRRLKMEVD